MLTKDAEKAQNKDYRSYRQKHYTKCSRMQTTQYFMHFNSHLSSARVKGIKQISVLSDVVKFFYILLVTIKKKLRFLVFLKLIMK